MKNTRYYLVEMERLTIAVVVVTKLASLAGCHRVLLHKFYGQDKEKMNQNLTVVFVCEHGAAKSILAAAYFNHLASQAGSGLRAIARGTHPDPELSPQTIQGLSKDGLTPTESSPRKLTEADIQSAHRVITFCELPSEYKQQGMIERWNDVPSVSENYEKARDVIIKRIRQMLDR